MPGLGVDPLDFALTGVNNVAYNIVSVDYDPTTFRATLNLTDGVDGFGLPVDEMNIHANDLTIVDTAGNNLDGEWTNHQSNPSGDGTAGGEFVYGINMSPGNFNLSLSQDDDIPADHGLVNIFDLGVWQGTMNTSIGSPGYDPLVDGNGDGLINVFDLGIWQANMGNVLPNGSAALWADYGNESSGGLIGEGEDSSDYGDSDFGFAYDDETLASPDTGANNGQSGGSYDDYASSVDSLFAGDEDDEDDEDTGVNGFFSL